MKQLNYDPADVMRQAKIQMPPQDVIAMEAVKEAGQEFLNLLNEFDSSSELSIAKTKTEEAVMWAVKAVTA